MKVLRNKEILKFNIKLAIHKRLSPAACCSFIGWFLLSNALLYGTWKKKTLTEYGNVTQCIAPKPGGIIALLVKHAFENGKKENKLKMLIEELPLRKNLLVNFVFTKVYIYSLFRFHSISIETVNQETNFAYPHMWEELTESVLSFTETSIRSGFLLYQQVFSIEATDFDDCF